MLQRLLRATSVIMLMFIADRLLSPFGLGWLAFVIGAVGFIIMAWLSWRQRDPLNRHISRWLSEGLEPASREVAIAEARQALTQAQSRRGSKWTARALRVRLTLAELLSAHGELAEASDVLDVKSPPTNVEERLALRLAQATVALRQGQREKVETLLESLPHTSAPLLSAQKKLLEIATLLAAEQSEEALERVNQVRHHCADFPSLRLQLRLYHAAALSQLGQETEAREIVGDLDAAARKSAKVYGLPPVRALLKGKASD